MPDLCPRARVGLPNSPGMSPDEVDVAPNRTKPLADSPPFSSRFPGRCPECETWWEEGDEIVHTDVGGYAHPDCTRSTL